MVRRVLPREVQQDQNRIVRISANLRKDSAAAGGMVLIPPKGD
jgi:hypothetical protein